VDRRSGHLDDPARPFWNVAIHARWCGDASSDFPRYTVRSFCCAISSELDRRDARSLAITPNTVKCGSIGLAKRFKTLIEREPGLQFSNSNQIGSCEHRTSF